MQMLELVELDLENFRHNCMEIFTKIQAWNYIYLCMQDS